MLASVITFVSKLIEYNEIEAEKKLLKARIAEKQARIEELQYWLEAPMDEDYIMKFAREKLDYYRSDEIVFTNDQNNWAFACLNGAAEKKLSSPICYTEDT